MQASISSGCRNDTALRGGWDAHSSALGYQSQHCEKFTRKGHNNIGPLRMTRENYVLLEGSAPMMRKKEARVARGLKKRESGTEFLFFFK
jgi:hypothetical protein